jgi:GntR family transcriptional regulator
MYSDSIVSRHALRRSEQVGRYGGTVSRIELDLKSKVPIYVQIRDQLRLMIATEELKPGEQMPPVRDLAGELLINPNTVAKAYHELEREGYIHTQRGMGTFVSERSRGLARTQRTGHARQVVTDLVSRLLELGLSAEEIRRLVDETLAAPGGKDAG